MSKRTKNGQHAVKAIGLRVRQTIAYFYFSNTDRNCFRSFVYV